MDIGTYNYSKIRNISEFINSDIFLTVEKVKK